jgi:flavodoxin
MKVIVNYESLWGSTAAVAEAIADGLGADAQAMSTAVVTIDTIADTDLIVAGSPVCSLGLPAE